MIISLKEARKILGKEMSGKLSDDELEKLINDLSFLAKESLKMAVEKRYEQDKESKNNPGT